MNSMYNAMNISLKSNFSYNKKIFVSWMNSVLRYIVQEIHPLHYVTPQMFEYSQLSAEIFFPKT